MDPFATCGPALVGAFDADGRLLCLATSKQIHLLSVPDLKVLLSKPHSLKMRHNKGIRDMRK